MKILHCMFGMGVGGAETMLIDIINRQVLTDKVTLIIINNLYSDNLLAKLKPEVRVIKLNRNPGSKNPWWLIRLNYTVLLLKPDVIHVHQSNAVKMLLPVFYNKVWRTIHDLNLVLAKSATIRHIAISDAVNEDVSTRYPGINVTTVANGINCDSIRQKDYSHSPSPATTFKIVQVGRLEHLKKGQDILLKAVSILKSRGIDDIEVTFIGEGDSEEELKGLARSLGISDKIHFDGMRNRDYIYEHLADYDIMCHPARYEGFGLVIAEGATALLPVIIPDSGGPFEILGQGKYCEVYPANDDAEGLADAILRVKNDYNRAMERALQARKHVIANYSIKNMVNKYRELYLSK
ncbi:MAG: glycosyltransferase [Duncaniella sp.]|nr:glycosyltransferase [Duncaniella sp.]HBI59032.1 glycosyltransferase [Porphyromonadaceae bacterium]